jgi:hypothetical protein
MVLRRRLLAAAVAALTVGFGSPELLSKLKAESELSTDCYGFPQRSFSRQNCVKCTYGTSPHVPVSVGDGVTDFTLPNIDGTYTTLSDVLVEKPVVLVWGMWTCPAFQGLGEGTSPPFDECSYRDEFDLVEAYAESVHFVHLVGPEPHPTTPDVNFDSGKQLMNYWSTVSQPRTWPERMAMAAKVASTKHPKAKLLIDTLADATDGRARNQPAWCSLGHGARTALLVAQDGSLVYSQTWFHKSDMVAAIDAHLADVAK